VDKAIAVKYATGLPAPFVVAKGRHELAQRLVAIAQSSGVEIVDMPELAESLITLEAGDWIPEEYFEVIAHILAFVYRLKAER
jgi:type III secretion system FlhB-like substrate exporter